MAFDRAAFIVAGFVLLNMVITLFIWCSIYEMKNELFYSHQPMMLDINNSLTTGNVLIDGLLNGLFIAAIIALMSIILGQCIYHQLTSYVIFFVKSSFLMMAYIMPATTIYDIFLKFLGSDNLNIYLYTIITSLSFTSLIITVYFNLILYLFFKAYFTNYFPIFLQQILSIFNCSFISIYYLRFLPRYTIWFLMIAVILWDLFAVNSSFGPLKVAALNAQNYNEGILRFMFFIAKNGKNDEEEISSIQNSENEENYLKNSIITDDDTLTFSYSSDNEQKEEEDDENNISEFTKSSNNSNSYEKIITEENNKNGERTAFDALNAPGQTIIGTGDFIIYGLLVGKAASDMNGWYNLPVLFTIIGVLIGLFYTLYLSEESDKNDNNDDNNLGYFPALPIPLTIGTFLYFLSSFIIKYYYLVIYC